MKTAVEIVISKFHNKPALFTGPKKFKIYREDYVKIPGVNTITGVVLQQEFGKRNIKVMLKNSHANSMNLDLRNVVLLDSQSTMDLFYNTKLVGKIYKAKIKMCLKSNGGKILFTHKS